MSKFFVDGNLSEEDDNIVNENESSSRNQPAYHFDFLGERESNEKRIVRSEKEKKWNIIKDYTSKVNGALNNQDFEKVWNLLQEMLREVEKMTKLIEKEGYPSFFLRCLHRIHEDIAQFNKNSDARKKMKKHSATAFNTMNQKMKKIYPEFEEHIQELLEHGEEEESEIEEESSSSESESDEDDITQLESTDPMVRRRYWLKKPTKKEKEKEKEKEEDKDKEEGKREDRDKHQTKKEVHLHLNEKKKVIEIQSIKDAEHRMREIRKNFMKLYNQDDREEYLLTLDKIEDSTQKAKDFEKLSFYLLDLPIRIDVCRQMKLTHFPRAQWLKLFHTIKEIRKLLANSEEEDLVNNIRLFEDTNSKNETARKVTEKEIYSSLKTDLILIENEIKKSLVFVSNNDIEYYERLQDLISLVEMMFCMGQDLEMKFGLSKEAAEMGFKVLENCYFMDGHLIEQIKKDLKVDVQFLELGDEEKIKAYANMILQSQPSEDVRIKTLLYLIYNHAINGREKGKQLLVISTLGQTISHQNYYTQVLYNRVIVQLGLMSFRQGNIYEVQQFLYEMCSMTKMKENTKDVLREFLAQGYVRFSTQDKTIPKSKVLPIYLHINTEVIECIELISSMLLEVPYTLVEGGRITSRTFKRFVYEYERNFFFKENLNNRDLIYSASLSLKEGDWEECINYLNKLTIWNTLPDADITKLHLLRTVKEQSLKCYLIGNRKCFRSIALAGLAEKFTLEEKAIRRHICKLMGEKILVGSITRAGYLVFVQKKQTDMQKICETFFEKVKEMNTTSDQHLSQKFSTGYDSDEQKQDNAVTRRSNLPFNEKLKAFISKRKDKF